MITAAYWIGGRACHRALTGQQFVELELNDAATVFKAANHDISAAVAAIDTVEPPSDLHVSGLLAAAEACRRAGELSANWLAVLTALVGAPWKARLEPSGRTFVHQHWKKIELVAAELLFERRALVSRVLELCNVKVFT